MTSNKISFLFLIPILVILISVNIFSVNHAFAFSNSNNTSIREKNENSTEVKANLNNLLTAYHMNHKAADNLQKYIMQQQKIHRELDKKYAMNYTQTEDWVKSKTILAKQQLSDELQYRINYIKSTSEDQLKSLLHAIQTHHHTRININEASKVNATNVSNN